MCTRDWAGSVLLAPRLMALLNLKTGDTIDVGDATLRIAGEVIQEPDSGFNPFQIAPRLMMNLADVDKTGAVQPGRDVYKRQTPCHSQPSGSNQTTRPVITAATPLHNR